MIALRARQRPFEVTGRFVLLCFVGFFLVVAAVNAVMIRFAVSTFGGVETESSYKAGLAFKAETAAALPSRRAALEGRCADRAGRRGRVVNVARARCGGSAVPHLVAEIRLAHPADRRRDVAMAVSEQSAGVFRAIAQGATQAAAPW